MEPMNSADMRVSVIDPINPAVERAKTLLFAPFDLGKWFVIGFCAWLAQPGRFNGGLRVGDKFDEAKGYVSANLDWIIPLAITVFVLMIAIVLVMMWLSSRGRFMFLDCVARHKAHVRDPWHRFRMYAASLFAFRVTVGIIGFAVMIALASAGGVFIWISRASGFNAASVLGLIVLGLLFVIITIVFALIGIFTTDFVVPIMYLHTMSCTQAWRMLLDVLSWNQGRFILYVLFQILLKVAIAALVMGVGCMTCCVGFCLMALPYVGTVILLPIRVFERSYSAYYLAQYGPQFNVFTPRPEAPVAAEQPI